MLHFLDLYWDEISFVFYVIFFSTIAIGKLFLVFRKNKGTSEIKLVPKSKVNVQSSQSRKNIDFSFGTDSHNELRDEIFNVHDHLRFTKPKEDDWLNGKKDETLNFDAHSAPVPHDLSDPRSAAIYPANMFDTHSTMSNDIIPDISSSCDESFSKF